MKKKVVMSPSAVQRIEAFWKWFAKNHTQVENAMQQGVNSREVLEALNKRIKNISAQVGFLIKGNNKVDKQFFTLIFTVEGQLKKVRWATAIEKKAPAIPNWSFQALIQPFDALDDVKSGLDKPFKFHEIDLKMSDMYFNMTDYDIHKRTISIKVYYQEDTFFFYNPHLQDAVEEVLTLLLGEIAFRNSISEVQVEQLPDEMIHLTPLYELPQYIQMLKNLNRKIKI